MKDRNRGFIIYGTFTIDGEKVRKNSFRKYEKEANALSKTWIKGDVEDVRIVPTSALRYCETCKKVVEFETIEEKRDDIDIKVKMCPVCKTEIGAF